MSSQTTALIAAINGAFSRVFTRINTKLDQGANAVSASKLATARNITIAGDVDGVASFDGSANITINVALDDTGVVAGTYPKVTVDAKGRVTNGAALAAADIPSIPSSKISDLNAVLAGKLDVGGVAVSAQRLQTSRLITLQGDATGVTGFDGNSDAIIYVLLPETGVVPGSYSKVTVDAKGRVTTGAALTAGDIPVLNQNTTGNAATATKLQTARNIGVVGDASGSVSFDGTGGVNIPLALSPTGVTAGEYGSNIQIPIPTVDAKGRITAMSLQTLRSGSTTQSGIVQLNNAVNSTLQTQAATPLAVKTAYDLAATAVQQSQLGVANGIATLDEGGKVPSAQLPSYVDEVLEFDYFYQFPATGEAGKLYLNLETGKVYRWTGTIYLQINGTVSSAELADRLATARTIAVSGDGSFSTSFDGSANVNATFTLANSGVVAGTYPKVQVDAKGRVIAGSALLASDVPTLNQNTTGNAATATKLATARTLSLSGDATGSVSFDGSADATISVTVADNSHAHTIANVTGLQTALNGKQATITGAISGLVSTNLTALTVAVSDANGKLISGGASATEVGYLSGVTSAIQTQLNAKAPLASPSFTGTPLVPTATDGTNNTQVASTVFVQSAVGRYINKSGQTGGTLTLTASEASNPVIAISGTLTSNLTVVVPNGSNRLWAFYNATSGAFTVTVKTVSGTGVTIAQGKRNLVYSNGTNVLDAFTDYESIAMTGTPTAPTAAAGTNTTQVATCAYVKSEIAASNAATATKLATARAINGVNFDGSANITIADSTKLPLAGGTLTGTLVGQRGVFNGAGNDYATGGVELTGNGATNTIFPTLGFHQPTAFASSLQLRAASDFRFYAQGASAYANVTANQFNGALNGNAATSSTLAGDETVWASYRSRAVANMLGWKNYGNDHVIFDASAGTAPNGVAKNNTTPDVPWAATYPTLMGWNGSNTYGVRVDRAAVAERASVNNLAIGTMATRAVTISTAGPSGGADGDVWLQYS